MQSLKSVAKMVAKKHMKFTDDDEFHTADEGDATNKQLNKKQDAEHESDADSSDEEAPEEENVSTAKDAVKNQIKEREEALMREETVAKEKRKKQQLKFKEQQEQKRQRESAEEQRRKMLEFEERLKAQQESALKEQELPEELSDDFFENLEKHESTIITTKPKHINFNDIAENNYTEELKKQIEKQKKKTLNHLRKKSLKRGPVTVSLLTSMTETKSLAPKKETRIMNTKDKWLRRKAVHRK